MDQNTTSCQSDSLNRVNGDRCLLLFVDDPEPGTMKQGLSAETSDRAASGFYIACVEHMLGILEPANVGDVVVCYAPETSRASICSWLGCRRRLMSQKGIELGRRMENAFRESFFMMYEQTLVIRSDIPELEPKHVEAAFAALDRGEVPVGPRPDGGCYLLGFSRGGLVPEVFSDMAWSSGRELGPTLESLQGLGVKPCVLEELHSMNLLDDLRGLVERSGEKSEPGKIAQGLVAD